MEYRLLFSEETPFMYAVREKRLDILKVLQKKGADVTALSRGMNALHLAILLSSSEEIVEWLIDVAESPIDAKGMYGKTPFISAAQNGDLKMLKMLKNKGADVQATDRYGHDALYYAVGKKLDTPGVVKWLQEECGGRTNSK